MRVPVDTLDPALRERLRLVRLVAFDFDGVFTDNAVYVSQDGTEAVRCVRSDGLGLQALTALGVATVIMSGAFRDARTSAPRSNASPPSSR
jgi:3-deoxy-D-manno-octulosonate 8-phosphate phosphatase KdsC-like HAD superfamily phosphatase